MRTRIAVVLVALFIARASIGEDGQVVPGTNVMMDSHDLFEWNRSGNIYRLPSGKGTMRAVYVRLPLDKAIERLKPWILTPPHFSFPKCEIDKEWSEGDDKLYLICHGKFRVRKDWEIKTYVFFIAKGDETYVFVSRLNINEPSEQESVQEIEARVLAAYQSSRIVDQPVDIRNALPYQVKLPANYLLFQMSGMESVYQIERGADRDPDFLSVTWWDDQENSQLRGVLPRHFDQDDVIVFRGTVRASPREREAWRWVSFDPTTRKYNVQYVTRKAGHVLGLDALISEKNYKANPREIERLAEGVKAKQK